ncbi:MAG: hypothetical protein LC659_04775, partial [Myxococcales bacterium]|nr:hypothetical protein [Myxococcales bacterium]
AEAARAAPLDAPRRALVREYAELERRLDGVAAGAAWLQPLLGANADAATQDLAIAWDIEQQSFDAARARVGDAERRGHRVAAVTKLALALAGGDLATVGELAARPPGELGRAERIEADRRLGWLAAARAEVRAGLAAPTRSAAEAALLANDAAELADERRSDVRASAGLLVLGPLAVWRQKAAVDAAVGDHVTLGLAPSLSELRSSLLSLAGRGEELDLAGSAELRGRRGHLDLVAGADWRADVTVAHARLTGALDLGPRIEAHAELALFDVTDESAAIRAAATRSRAGAGAALQLTSREYLAATFDVHQYRARDGALLANGLAAELELGERLSLAAPECILRLQGGVSFNQLAGTLPPSVQALLPSATDVAAIIPAQFALAGAGALLGHRFFGGALRLSADLWAGWIGLPSRLGYHARVGVGVPLFGGLAELGGAYANDQAAAVGEPIADIELSYVIKWGR